MADLHIVRGGEKVHAYVESRVFAKQSSIILRTKRETRVQIDRTARGEADAWRLRRSDNEPDFILARALTSVSASLVRVATQCEGYRASDSVERGHSLYRKRATDSRLRGMS